MEAVYLLVYTLLYQRFRYIHAGDIVVFLLFHWTDAGESVGRFPIQRVLSDRCHLYHCGVADFQSIWKQRLSERIPVFGFCHVVSGDAGSVILLYSGKGKVDRDTYGGIVGLSVHYSGLEYSDYDSGESVELRLVFRSQPGGADSIRDSAGAIL